MLVYGTKPWVAHAYNASTHELEIHKEFKDSGATGYCHRKRTGERRGEKALPMFHPSTQYYSCLKKAAHFKDI